MSKEEKFNELNEESKDRKAFRRKTKFAIKDRDIFEIIKPAYHNYKIACRIEQLIKDYHYIIVCLHPLQIDVEIDNSHYSICGHIDDRQIAHLVVTNIVRYDSDNHYMRKISENSYMRIDGDFSLFFEYVINVHESELEQELEKALTELSHYHD